MKLIMQYSSTSCHFLSHWPKYFQHAVLKHPHSSLRVRDEV
jgi:hypothetical protein